MASRTEALRHLKRVDPKLYQATLTHHASLPATLSSKRTSSALLNALISIVISQQLGTAAADAIFRRARKASGGHFTAELLLKTSRSAFATAGLSSAKIKTMRSIARAVRNKSLNLAQLRTLPETEISEQLLAIWGIGPWSVDMFMLFALGKGDVFSPGDLGLIRAMETLYGISNNAPREIFIARARTWSPHRTYASLLLWRSRNIVPKTPSKGRHR